MNREHRSLYLLSAFILTSCALLAPVPVSAAPQAEETIVLFDNGRIAPGVQVVGVAVGDMDQAAAAQALTGVADSIVQQAQMKLSFPDHDEMINLVTLGVTPDVNNAAKNAMLVGRSGNMAQRQEALASAQAGQTNLGIGYTFDENTVSQQIRAYAATIPRDSVKGELIFNPDSPERFIIEEGHLGFEPDVDAFVAVVTQALREGTLDGVQVPGTTLGDAVEEIKPGTKENTVLVATYSTKVTGSSGRVHNVKTASDFINGTIVQPGEEFSTNDCLGPRTSSTIWRKAPAISGGVYVDELGGGICQVSSTLFNAVARADLEITSWVNHSWPSSYVPIGCDATISTGGPDFKFRNNTEWPIYLVSHYDESTKMLNMEVWGRPLPNGQRIELEGKRTGTVAKPAAITVTDPAKVTSGRIGQYSQTTKVVYDAQGNEISREVIRKNYYKAYAPRVLAKPTPAPTATPDVPAVNPTTAPTKAPTTPAPTTAPTVAPTAAPATPAPTAAPTTAAE